MASRKTRSSRRSKRLEIGFVPFSPLGKGFLTGKIDETTTFDPPTSATPFPLRAGEPRSESGGCRSGEANRVRERRDAGADRTGAAPRQKEWIVPIPGTTKRHRLEENLSAVAVELSATTCARSMRRRHRLRFTATIECPNLSDLRPRASQILSSGKSYVSFACNRDVVTI
jgi:aryl-alcohol dehydrogenase-like predicted oxidoreductase